MTWRALVAVALFSCGEPSLRVDAGTEQHDAGMELDASVTLDASIELDAGVDAGLPDAGDPCAGDFETKLRCVRGLTVTRLGMSAGFTRYALHFEQPVDHSRPDAGVFLQRATLAVSNVDRPVVLVTSGYFLIDRQHELSRVYGANQLSYEYRYFGDSKPSSIDWSTNTLEQGANDAHRWVQALKPLFPKKWVNAGVSKGGISSLAHRQHFPDDVDATVAYGTPFSTSRLDPRTAQFLANDIGGPARAACRTSLAAFQREVMMRKTEILPLITTGTYTRLTKSRAFDHTVVDFGFSYWMYTLPGNTSWGCPAIPATGASASALYQFVDHHSGWDGLSDDAIAVFQPYYVSTATELGGPAPYDSHLSALLTTGEYAAGSPDYLPQGIPAAQFAYRPQVQQSLSDFVSNRLTRAVFVIGENDPWGAQRYTNVHGNSSLMVVDGLHTATISEGPATERAAVWAALDGWLEATAVAPRSLIPVEPAWDVMSEEERRFGRWLR